MSTDILETAAIGVPPPGGGPERLAVAVVLKDPDTPLLDLSNLAASFNSALQKKLNPLFKVWCLSSLQTQLNWWTTYFPFLRYTQPQPLVNDIMLSERIKFAGIRNHSPLFSSKNSHKQSNEEDFEGADLSK